MAFYRRAFLAVVALLNISASKALDLRSINSSSPTTTLVTTTHPAFIISTTVVASSTTNSLASITTCIPSLATVPIEYFLPESLLTAPLTDQFNYYLSIANKYQSYLDTYSSIIASRRSDSAAISYVNSIFSVFHYDVARIFGPGGEAMIKFNDLRTDPCLYSTCFNQYFDQRSSFTRDNPAGSFVFAASAPCCDRCSIFADNVDVEYWPTPAPTPPVSTLVDEASNFTFVSPSAYVRYTNLYAQDLCGQVGHRVPFTRLAFDPTELTTSYLPLSIAADIENFAPENFYGVWKRVNFADFDSPNCTCTTNCRINPLDNKPITYTCEPRLSVHPRVSAIDPLWATCRQNLYGFFDPPVALPRAVGLTAPKTTIVESTPVGPRPTSTPVNPAPVNSPTPPIVRPTTTPAPQPQITTTSRVPVAVSSSSIIGPVVPNPVISNPVAPNPIAPVPVVSEPIIPAPPNPSPVIVPGPANPDLPSSRANSVQGGSLQPVVPVTVIGSQTFVFGPSPTVVIVGGSSFTIPGTVTATPVSRPLTINGQVVTPDSKSKFVIGSQTLTPGGPAITLSGTVISIAPGASGVLVEPLSGQNTKTSSSTVESASSTVIEFTGAANPLATRVNQISWVMMGIVTMLIMCL